MSNTVSAAAEGLPTRRRALATLAAAGAVLALPRAAHAASVADHPDARLLAWGAKLEAIEAQVAPLRDVIDNIEDTSETDAVYKVYDELAAESHRLSDLVAAEPAHTLDGFRVKARTLARIYHEGFTAERFRLDQGSTDNRLAWSILSGLLTIGGAA